MEIKVNCNFMRQIICGFILVTISSVSFCQTSPMATFDSLINNQFLLGSFKKQVTGPITENNKAVGKSTIIAFVDTINQRLLKVIQIDSVLQKTSYKVLYYLENALLKVEIWTESDGQTFDYGSYYYSDGSLVTSKATHKETRTRQMYIGLSKEYLSTQIR